MKRRRRARRALILAAIAAALALLGLRRLIEYHPTWSSRAVALSFAGLAGTMLVAWLNPRRTITSERAPRRMFVTVVVPVHNEDPVLFRRCLRSMTRQTRLPDKVHVIDDGSSTGACQKEFRRWAKKAGRRMRVELTTQANQGKRHAQAHAFRDQQADIFCTVDSDTVLDERAIEESLKPFADPRIMGVAGRLLGYNYAKNLLTRILELEFSNSFIIGRSWMSTLRSVLVACGGLACYRAEVVRENLDDYLGETFLGRPVRSGDDRKLTQYALLRGGVVHQESAIGYTALPERMSHLIRQRLRWSKSFYRGTAWSLRHLPIRSAGFWITLWRATSGVVFASLWTTVVLVAPAMLGSIAVFYLLYVAVLAYLRSLRYLAVERPAMPARDQALTFLLAPLVALLYLFILIPVRYVAILKLRDPGWGTRKRVEVAVA